MLFAEGAHILAAHLINTMQNLRDLLLMMRPTQWFKSLFVVVGAAPALFLLSPSESWFLIIALLIIGMADLVMVQGMSYIINDFSDLQHDVIHPTKKGRPLASGKVSPGAAYALLIALFISSSILAYAIDVRILSINFVILALNALYSVRPFRLRDVFLVDILCIGWTAPLRVLVGWFLFEPYNKAPMRFILDVGSSQMASNTIQEILFHSPSKVLSLSLSMSTTTTGAAGMIFSTYFLAVFMLSSKRLAELLAHSGKATCYRAVLSKYTIRSLKSVIAASAALLALCFVVLSLSIKPVLLLLLPPLLLMLGWYYDIVFVPDTPVKEPEKIFRAQKKFTAAGVLILIFGLILLLL
jgi:4-hydroxybenzoate polyprenyltransferase